MCSTWSDAMYASETWTMSKLAAQLLKEWNRADQLGGQSQ